MSGECNGLIDGSAPPFIVLVFVLGTMYTALNVHREAEELAGGISFKVWARVISILSMVWPFFLGSTVCFRIFKNYTSRDSYNFWEIDLFILIGILVCYLAVIINALISSRIKRKYKQE